MFLIEHMMAIENLDSIVVGMAEWSKAIGLRLIGAIRRRFKSYSPHFLFTIRALTYLK